MAIPGFATRDEAWHQMDTLLEDRWGSAPEAIEHLQVREYPCRHEVGGGSGMVIVAMPKGGAASADQITTVYFGDPIPKPLAVQER